MNLIVYYGQNKNILKIVSKYKEIYKANIYRIETVNNINFLDKLKSCYLGININIKRNNVNLLKYDNVILISDLWFNKIPSPVIRFLELETGKINNIIYVLYNHNKEDCPFEFERMDRILNLRRDKSYFVSLDKKDIHVRVYQ